MRKLLLLLIVLSSIAASSQQWSLPVGNHQRIAGLWAERRLKLPADTAFTKEAGCITLINGVLYVADGTKWNTYASGGGSSAGVSSFDGRFGAVVPQTGDYTINMITGGLDSIRRRVDSIWLSGGSIFVRKGSNQNSFPISVDWASGYPTYDGRYPSITRFLDTSANIWSRVQSTYQVAQANYSTTYALSNDLRDTLGNRYTKAQADARFLQSFTESDPVWTAAAANYYTKTQADARFLQSFTETDPTVYAWAKAATKPAYAVAEITGLQTALDGKQNVLGFTPENAANKGVANGFAALGSDSKILAYQLPQVAINQTFTVNSQSAMLALSANQGDIAVRTDQNKAYILAFTGASTLANWIALPGVSNEADPVFTASVAFGITGTNVSNWNTAFGWGNHAGLYVPLSRTITINGTSLDLSANRSFTVGDVVTSGSYTNPTWIASLAWSKITGAPSFLTGNQTITLSGDATGSGATSIALTLANSGVTAGTYTKVTVDAKGRVTTGASLASGDVTGALGYTPYNATNPSGYLSSVSLTSNVTGVLPVANGGTGQTTIAGIQSALGLGSYAYRSSGLAELSGATFTGAISGTSASFSSTLGVTGAATFSSSVSTGGNVALNSALSGWQSFAALQIGTVGALAANDFGGGNKQVFLGNNVYYDAGGFKYTTTGSAAMYRTLSNSHVFSVASSGTAGNVISFTDALTIASTGAATFSSLSGSGNRIVFANSSGQLGSMVIGSGLSFDGTTLTATGGSSGTVTGSGTSGVIPLWNSASDIGNSVLSQTSGNLSATGQITATQFNGSGAGLTSVPWGSITGAPSFLTTAVTSLSGTTNQISVSASTGAVTVSLPSAVTISGNMTAAAFFESSDIRLKDVFQTYSSADDIPTIQYTFKGDFKVKYGYSAQQVQKIIPSAVEVGSDGFYKVDYTSVHSYKIMMLEKRIADLERRVNNALPEQGIKISY